MPQIVIPQGRIIPVAAKSGGGFWSQGLVSAPPTSDGQGYIAFDVPLIEQSTTGTSMTVRLVRREGVTGSVTVSVSAEDKFRAQGVQSYAGESVTFAEGDLTKTISVPLNSITLDGEAHFYLRLSGNSITYNDIRFHETNCLVVVDDGSEASDGVVLTDPSTQIIQDNIADNTIIYVGNGTWDDPARTGYTPIYNSDEAVTIYQKQNVVLRNRPGQSPVISINNVNAGVYILDCDYVHVRGFEITAPSAGITGIPVYCRNYLGRDNPENYFDNKYYYIWSNSIHDWYGGDNSGGIRLDDSYRALAFNNLIYRGFDVNGTSNGITADPYDLHAGIHGYRPRECVILQNTIHTVKRSVYQKDPNAQSKFSNMVVRNLMYDMEIGAAVYEHAGALGNVGYDVAVFENVCIGQEACVIDWQEAESQCQRAKVYNNTSINTHIVGFDFIAGVRIWNNLISGSNGYAIRGKADGGGASSIKYCDYNGYGDTGYTWDFDRYSTDSRSYTTLAGWQASDDSSGQNTTIVAGPDANAATGAPVFTDAANDNYSLTGANTQYLLSGRYGDNMGAVRLGHEQIGAE